ncbi:SH3 domain-containing protein [Lysobacter cavernae]|uniref:SH3 domain-containing protein n=1 Tax=Lysobacter cavernae TaxID=1685901 RepID=A0ABV7RN89_9GAMM
MNITRQNRNSWLALLGILLLAVVPLAGAQCPRAAYTVGQINVHADAPTFSTGGGWQQAGVLESLPPNTRVTVCEERTVGIVDQRLWYRIEYDGRQGWVYSGWLRPGDGSTRREPAFFSFGLIATAVAAPAAPGGTVAASPMDDGLPRKVAGASVDQQALRLVALVFVLLGMVGKVVYDVIEKHGSKLTWKILSVEVAKPANFMKAVIAAPIACISMLQTGDYVFESGVAVALSFFLSFQNGFFWQTLLPARRN